MMKSQDAIAFRSVVRSMRSSASLRDTRGRLFDSSGAKRRLFSTSVRARSSTSLETSTTTAEIPCSTRSVITPIPMLPAPMTPMLRNSLSGMLPSQPGAPALTAQRGRGVAGRRFRGGCTEAGREQPYGRALEQAHHRQRLVQLPLDRGNHQHRLERVAARVEEVVVDADPWPAEDFLPDVRERGFERAARQA